VALNKIFLSQVTQSIPFFDYTLWNDTLFTISSKMEEEFELVGESVGELVGEEDYGKYFMPKTVDVEEYNRVCEANVQLHLQIQSLESEILALRSQLKEYLELEQEESPPKKAKTKEKTDDKFEAARTLFGEGKKLEERNHDWRKTSFEGYRSPINPNPLCQACRQKSEDCHCWDFLFEQKECL
jgi:hypothetical protein